MVDSKRSAEGKCAKWPNKIGAKDLYREFTFKQWNERSCRLANALADMGMKKGDRFAALAYNCWEWLENICSCRKGRLHRGPHHVQAGPAGDGVQHEPQRVQSDDAPGREEKTGRTVRSSRG